MPSKEFLEAEKELDRLQNFQKRLNETNTKILEGNEVLETLMKTSVEYRHNLDKNLRPYVQELINVRMSFGRETQEILRFSRELGQLTKTTNDIIKFVDAMAKLKEVLTPDFVETLRKIMRTDNA